MDEIEVKVLEIDVESVTAKIVALGAKKVFDGPVDSIFFDKPDQSLHDNQILLRLRRKSEKNLLTFKKRSEDKDIKSCEEHETYLEDFEATKKLLLGLGFIIIEEDHKRRISYNLGKINYEIEFREGIPPYLEVEATSKQELVKALKELGYSLSDTKPWGGGELLRHYGKKSKFKF